MLDNIESLTDTAFEGRDKFFMDIDRMINEGLGGGQVTEDNGLIEETTTDTMCSEGSPKAGSITTEDHFA